MRQIFFILFFAFSALSASLANAQKSAWIQIDSQPSLREAQGRIRAYAGVFDNINGFSIGSGWYAIALGPFTPARVEIEMDRLMNENQIPRDSFIADGRAFRQQFWPVGIDNRAQPPVTPVGKPSVCRWKPHRCRVQPPVTPVDTPIVDVTPIAPPTPFSDETPRQARRSEADLTKEERKLLQVALKWEGFYSAAIDGAFGRGTRGAMLSYQESMGYDPTGVLTALQRAELIEAYNAILVGIGLAPVRDDVAGIEIDMPTALVKFARYQPPFAHYDAKGDSGVRVLLISQPGDLSMLFGLYDVMQTLEIVPGEGERKRGKSSFFLTGQNDEIHSYTQAALSDGMIKGFTLIWPAEDEKRGRRVVENMKASFAAIGDIVLDENLVEPSVDQRIDLLAGLEIRRPAISRSGFYVDADGRVLTTLQAVQNCKRISLDETHDAEITFVDDTLGIALLKPLENLSPATHANFRTGIPRLQSEVAVSGYSYEGALGAATLTFGRLSDIRGLRGEADLRRLALTTQPGDAGGPVFDMTGNVLGMLLPKADTDGQRLPDGVSFAIGAAAIGKVLAQNDVVVSTSQPADIMHPEDLTTLATDMTVLVGCWN